MLALVNAVQALFAAELRFFNAPRMFRNARQSWRTISAQARSCQPHKIQSTLLNRNSQNPQLRLNFFCEPTIHAAMTVTAMAGHWIKSSMSSHLSKRRSHPMPIRRCDLLL